jgi:hypothetical protein
MDAAIVVGAEAAGTAATRTDDHHRVIPDLHLPDVGETMTTIADHHRLEQQIPTCPAKTEIVTDHQDAVDHLPQAGRRRHHRDVDDATPLLNHRVVHHDEEGGTAAVKNALDHGREIGGTIAGMGDTMTGAADLLHLLVDVAHHRLGVRAGNHSPIEAVRHPPNGVAEHLDHRPALRQLTPMLQLETHLARRMALWLPMISSPQKGLGIPTG